MTSRLCNPKYYKGVFFKIRKFMEVREEGGGRNSLLTIIIAKLD